MKFYVIRDGSAVPVAVVQVYDNLAHAFTHDLAWAPSDLPGQGAEECSYDESRQHLYEIVRHVRAERQRTQWQGEYEYFVSLEHPGLAETLKSPKALVRRRDGVREQLGADGTWRAAGEVPEGTVSVAVSEAEHNRLRWEIAESPWLVAEDERSDPVVVVRRIPGVSEAYTPNLRWEPVPPGRELEGHPHRMVRDVSPGAGLVLAYHLARRVRQFKQQHEWGGEAWYFGIYKTYEAAFDIGATGLLVKTRVGDPWFGERYAGQGRWEETRKLDDIWRGRSHDDELALSPAEAEAIMNRLG